MSQARQEVGFAGKGSYLLLALAVLGLDQWTKWLIERHLPLGTSNEVVRGWLHISHLRNSGVAFGLFADHGAAGGAWLLAALGLVAIVIVTVYFRRAQRDDVVLLLALSLVLGGAAGNLLDRVATGAVTDFVGVYLGSYRWPDFNVADSAISIGLVLLVFDSFRSPRAEADPADAQ